ncbi:MAG: hydrogenase iron-sulfur subunit [Clostridiales bacterium]|nr:hydrogenase iron-sulfur subunit [Clostridiales bacterium]
MDQEKEASAYLVQQVLLQAGALVEGKNPLPVLVAGTSIRCGVGELEQLYRETRQKGVTFLKYDTVSVTEAEEMNRLTFVGEGRTVEAEAAILVDCAEGVGEDLQRFAEKMRLRRSEGEEYSRGRWFLSSGFTGRRNVWVLDDSLWVDHSQTTLSDIAETMEELTVCPQELAADVDDTKCAFCYTCYRLCPHGAPKPDSEKHAMTVEDTLCAGCGICVSVCPAKAISLKPAAPAVDSPASAANTPASDKKDGGHNGAAAGEEDTCMKANQQAINTCPAAGSEDSSLPVEEAPVTGKKGRCLALCCENSAEVAAKEAFDSLEIDGAAVACGGEISEERILRGLKEYEKVLVAVCPDRACRHFRGNTHCRMQVNRARKTLETLGLNAGRVDLVQASFAAPELIREAARHLIWEEEKE